MDNEWEDITPTQDNEWEDITPQAQAPQKQGFMGSLMESLSRPGASVRARVRELGQSGDIKKANQAASAGWQDPGSVETFQNENLRNINKILPENANTLTRYTAGTIPSAAGLAGDIITDPVQVGGAIATDGLMGLLSKIGLKGLTLGERATHLPVQKFFATKGGQVEKATDLAIKARNEATRLYPQAQGSLEDVRNMGEATAKYVRPAKNAEELANQLEIAKGINAGEKQNYLNSGKIAYTTGQHDDILVLINEAKQSPNANTLAGRRRLKALQEARDADLEFLNQQSKETLNDPNFYQKQKQFYQSEADKAGAYRENPSQAIKAEANKAMARGYEKRAQAVDEAIRPMNTEEKGLIQSYEQARELAKAEALDMKPNLGKEVVSSISGSPVQTGARFVRKGLMDRVFGSPVKGITKKVSSLMDKSNKEQAVADLIDTIIAKRSEPADLEYPKQIGYTPPEPSQIGWEKQSAIRRMLPPGISSGKPIKMGYDPSRQAIELPELTETQMQELAKRWGPDIYNVRESVPLTPPSSPLTRGDKGISTKMRKTLKKLMEQRKRNFPS